MSAKQHSLRQVIALAAGCACVAFLGLQFVRPTISSPPVTAEIQAPPEVRQILRNSCYNCHSNETNLAWFDKIVPAYWLVSRDVMEARRHLNFSEIGAKPLGQQRAALYEAVFMIQMGAMPLPSYLHAHPGAAITPQQLAVLRAYLAPPASTPPSPAAEAAAADTQYQNWIHSAPQSTTTVRPAPNGIQFPADYKNWRVISSSDRFDNHTMREILGNPVAIQAIADHHINPWPDGTVFAKVAWLQQTDSAGIVHAGQFYQVEFMIRDSQKYAATKGWGWARWRGLDLKPYGANARFTGECVTCHSPLRSNNYVFTEPIERQLAQSGKGD
jgi:hypothetical protein